MSDDTVLSYKNVKSGDSVFTICLVPQIIYAAHRKRYKTPTNHLEKFQ